MITLRRASERGRFASGWLDSRHTFSFGSYYDPRHLGFRSLRVLNDDRVAPGGGFPTHPHDNMEILSVVLEGALAHEDSAGHGGVLRLGDVQRMSAGTGIRHSEVNHSKTEPVHFLQVWIVPETRGLSPSYEQRSLGWHERSGALQVLASRDGREGSMRVCQDVTMYGVRLARGERVELSLSQGRHAWVHVATGSLRVQGHALEAGDGLGASDEALVSLEGGEGTALVFDLA
ncbi:MAG: pirin family protein [Deltaproteobacteria bacterium]|nr:pirin family protein [Deltaproteobacteria bacterium]